MAPGSKKGEGHDAQDAHWDEIEEMLRTQIRSRDIHDPALEAAFHRFPRHWFVPASLQHRACDDGPLPIGEGQTISQPYIVALMTHLLRLTGDEKVLEIGTGCGYQSVMLAALCSEVHSVEVVPELYEGTKKRLAEFTDPAIKRIHLYLRNGRDGVPEAAPFDRILCAATADTVPEAWKSQLRTGGWMVLPLGREAADLVIITKQSETEFTKRVVIPVRFVPLV
jgi:protein-L-isoaspartate(D-aspartate) O-methyltransferase